MMHKVQAASSEGCHYDCQKVWRCLLKDAQSPGNDKAMSLKSTRLGFDCAMQLRSAC